MKSGIRDNRARGKVADFLQEKAANGSRLSVVSAYFTIYAYDALSEQLDGIESLKFLFGEPKFIQTLDPEKTDKKAFKIEDEGPSSSVPPMRAANAATGLYKPCACLRC